MSERDVAEAAARAAGALLRERFAQPGRGVETKSSATDMVSDADRAAESLIVKRIRAAFPRDAILGEESGASPGDSGRQWIVDPLDGTTNFLYGIPHFAVSIACTDEGGGIAGAVYDPMRDELFAASRGAGAVCNGKPIAVSAADDLARALVATGFSYRAQERAAAAAMLPLILPAVRDLRRAGAAALDLAWVACGRLDGYYESPCLPWDRAAGDLIVREAGGVIEDLPALGVTGPGVLASSPGIARGLSALVARARECARRSGRFGDVNTSEMDLSKANTFITKLGIAFVEATAERVEATMPVDGNTQPDGFLHGGATMALIESLASFGAAAAAGWPENLVVGQQQTCNFMAPATSGAVRGIATPLHKGRTTHVWDVDVTSVETGRRIASGRVTLAVRPRRASS